MSTISAVSEGRIDEIEPIPWPEAPSRARRIVEHGDIIWSSVRPNLKAYSLILDPVPNMVVSTGVAVVYARRAPYTYLYHALTTDEFVEYLTKRATGAAYPAVNVSDFEDVRVVLPPSGLLEPFDKIVRSKFDLKQVLLQKNDNLRETRDLLLPKLVSGEVDVSEVAVDSEPLNH